MVRVSIPVLHQDTLGLAHPRCARLQLSSNEVDFAVQRTRDIAHQYVVRPPEMSNVAAVENEHSSLASQHTSAAFSLASPRRPIGIFDFM
jgi:hypothetical protein